MKKIFTFCVVMMAALNAAAIDYYGRAIANVDAPETGYVWVTIKGTSFSGEFTQMVADTSYDGKMGTWDHSYTATFYAKPADGYVFAGWYDTDNNLKSVSMDNYCKYEEKFSAKSRDANAPTEFIRNARFVKANADYVWGWVPEVATSGNYYMMNTAFSQANPSWFAEGSVATINPLAATLFTLDIVGNSTTISFQSGTETIYVSEAKGIANWSTNVATWTMDTKFDGYSFMMKGDADRYISMQNSLESVHYPKVANAINGQYTWYLISEAQMDAYAAYKEAEALLNGDLRQVQQDTLNAVLAENGYNSAYDFATRAANLKAVVALIEAGLPLDPEPTAIRQAADEQKAVKFVKNGKLYFRQGNRIYTADGKAL